MKAINLSFVFVLFLCLSCTENDNSPLTQQEKEDITSEVKVVINSIYDGMRHKDVVKAFKESFLNVPEFKYVGIDGEIMTYTNFYETANKELGAAEKVDFDFKKIVIDVVSKDAAIVTSSFDGTFYYTDSKLTFFGCGTTMFLQKTVDGWKVLHMQESIQESRFVMAKLE